MIPIRLSQEDIEAGIRHLAKAHDPYGLTDAMVKLRGPPLHAHFYDIFNQAIQHCSHKEWKVSNALPMHKDSDISDINNMKNYIIILVSSLFTSYWAEEIK